MGLATLVCGAFSSTPAFHRRLVKHLSPTRDAIYASYEQCSAEQQLPQEQRMDFVVIATPNHLHYPGSDGSAGVWVSCGL